MSGSGWGRHSRSRQSLGSPRFKHVVASAGTFCSQSSAYTFAWIMGKRERKHRNKRFAFHAAQEKPLTATLPAWEDRRA